MDHIIRNLLDPDTYYLSVSMYILPYVYLFTYFTVHILVFESGKEVSSDCFDPHMQSFFLYRRLAVYIYGLY